MNDDTDYEESDFDGERYRWVCTFCGDCLEDENDIRGQVVTCESCGEMSRVSA